MLLLVCVFLLTRIPERKERYEIITVYVYCHRFIDGMDNLQRLSWHNRRDSDAWSVRSCMGGTGDRMEKITFEDIKAANDSIQTTDIKGKAYAEVNQRIKAFRMVYPTGFIITSDFRDENGVCTITKQVGFYDEQGHRIILGESTAYEKEGSTFINKTSYIENCDTSATGRALGMAGFGIDTSVASAEEVQNAIANQNKKAEEDTIDSDMWDRLKLMYTKDEIKGFYKELGITKGMDIPVWFYLQKEAEHDAKFKAEHPEKTFY